MNKQAFLNKFQLQPLAPSLHQFKFSRKVKNAAVLVPIVEQHNELFILLTKRAEHLTHHPGQISFPGGKVEKTDNSLTHTALREAKEEVGLNTDNVSVLGQLAPYHTVTGFNITPVVGLITEPLALQIDTSEVEEVFLVPLTHFINQKNHTTVAMHHQGKIHHVYYMPYQHYNIWGATAAIIADLVLHLNN